MRLELTRAEPNAFRVHPLNRSGTLSDVTEAAGGQFIYCWVLNAHMEDKTLLEFLTGSAQSDCGNSGGARVRGRACDAKEARPMPAPSPTAATSSSTAATTSSDLLSGRCHCSEGRGDRAGAYIIDIILAYRYAWKRNLKYCGGVGGSQFPNALALLGLPPRLQFRWNCRMIPARLYRPHLRSPHESSDDDDSWPPAFLAALRAGQRAECSSKRSRVVVHLRRGDVTPKNQYHGKYTNNTMTLAILQRLHNDGIRAADVLIHSESSSFEPLDVFTAKGYKLALDAPLERAWSDMICASVLLLARSSFSYVPALFNGDAQHRILYQPFPRHAPLPSWEMMWPNETSAAARVHMQPQQSSIFSPTQPHSPMQDDVTSLAVLVLMLLPYAAFGVWKWLRGGCQSEK